MDHDRQLPLDELPLSTLFQAVHIYERRLIEGSASAEDIDRYVQCQLELADRLAYRESAADPRD